MNWSTVGDVVHAASLINVILFSATVAFTPTIFDPEWRQHGFCVANADVPYISSHDLCLYADFVLGGVMAITYALLRHQPGMQPANEYCSLTATLGIIGHGIGHGAIAAAMRQQQLDNQDDGVNDRNQTTWESIDTMMSSLDIIRQFLPYLVFWVLLMKSAMPKASWPAFTLATVSTAILGLFIPEKMGFTYVQLILFLAFDYTELTKMEKGFEYALYAMMVSFPVGVVGWIESTLCSKGVMEYLGGHLIYDAYIPLSMLAFYMVCWIRNAGLSTNNTSPKLKQV